MEMVVIAIMLMNVRVVHIRAAQIRNVMTLLAVIDVLAQLVNLHI